MSFSIVNELIDHSAGQNSQDELLEERILSRLKAQLPRPVRPRVQLLGRLVVLTGEVRSYFEKQMSQEVVRQTPGVERVVNLLIVKAAPGTSEWVSKSMILGLMSA